MMRPGIAGVVALAIACWLAGTENAFGDQPDAVPNDITVLHDLQYREGTGKAGTLDLAMPRERSHLPRPAIVVIHGGGWLEGDKSSFASSKDRVPGNIVDFAKLGFVAVTINYRLSAEAPFPAALDDCQCAVRWLRAHAGQYDLDSNHIGAYGNSAGGHLAMLLGMIDRPAGHNDQEPNTEPSSQVQAVVSDSGPLDLLYQHQHDQLKSVIEKFMGGPPEGPRSAEYKRASPVNYVLQIPPPLLLIYGAADTQVNVNVTDEFVAALGRSGRADVSYFRLANVGHCPHSLIRIPYLQQAVNEFFLRTLGSPSK